MKFAHHHSAVSDFVLAPPVAAPPDGHSGSTAAWVRPVAVADDVETAHIRHYGDPAKGRLSARNWVVLLAFGQSLLFLAIWLFWCTMAGAAPPPAGTAGPIWQLQESTYQPKKIRDPFGPAGRVATATVPNAQPVGPIQLQLQGILYQPGNPSALVNNQLLSLNRPVTILTENGEMTAKAIRITKDLVVVEVGGQTVELRTESKAPSR